MAKRRIEWSSSAKIELFEILNFYYRRNGNRNYSIKLNRNIQSTLKLLIMFPQLGMKTSEGDIRVIFEGNFSVFYELSQSQVIIHSILDNQKNYEQNKHKKPS